MRREKQQRMGDPAARRGTASQQREAAGRESHAPRGEARKNYSAYVGER